MAKQFYGTALKQEIKSIKLNVALISVKQPFHFGLKIIHNNRDTIGFQPQDLGNIQLDAIAKTYKELEDKYKALHAENLELKQILAVIPEKKLVNYKKEA